MHLYEKVTDSHLKGKCKVCLQVSRSITAHVKKVLQGSCTRSDKLIGSEDDYKFENEKKNK